MCLVILNAVQENEMRLTFKRRTRNFSEIRVDEIQISSKIRPMG